MAKSWYEVSNEDIANNEFNEAFARASMNPHSDEFLPQHSAQTYSCSWLSAFDLISPDRPQDQFEWCIIVWAASNRVTKLAQSKGLDIKCIRYEHLVSEKEKYILKVFDYLGIDQNLVREALAATERDSHQGTKISHEIWKTKKLWVRSEELIRKCDRMLLCLGYPGLESDFILPNTL